MNDSVRAGGVLSLSKATKSNPPASESAGIKFDVTAIAYPEDAAAFMHAHSLQRPEMKHSFTLQGSDFATAEEWEFVVGSKPSGIQIKSASPADPATVKSELINALKDSYRFYGVEIRRLSASAVTVAAEGVVKEVLVPALERYRGDKTNPLAIHTAVVNAVHEYKAIPSIIDERTRDLYGIVSSLVVNRALKRTGSDAEICVLKAGAYRWTDDGDCYQIIAAAKQTERTSVRALCSPKLAKIKHLEGLSLNEEERVEHFFALCMVQIALTIDALMSSSCIVFSSEDEIDERDELVKLYNSLRSERWESRCPALIARYEQGLVRHRQHLAKLMELDEVKGSRRFQLAQKLASPDDCASIAQEICVTLLPERIAKVFGPIAGKQVAWLNNQTELSEMGDVAFTGSPKLPVLELAFAFKDAIEADPLLSLLFNVPDEPKFQFVDLFDAGDASRTDGQGILIPPEWKTATLMPALTGISVLFCE